MESKTLKVNLYKLTKNQPAKLNTMLSEILLTNIENKARLQALIIENCDKNLNDEKRILDNIEKLQSDELLRLFKRMESERSD